MPLPRHVAYRDGIGWLHLGGLDRVKEDNESI